MNDFVLTLRALVESSGLNPITLSVPLKTDDIDNIQVVDRHNVPVTDGEKVIFGLVPMLTSCGAALGYKCVERRGV